MLIDLVDSPIAKVALRKESVDRNADLVNLPGKMSSVALRKESVDRNICCHLLNIPAGKVALRKESVDRNIVGPSAYSTSSCRSPQGERG